MKTNADVGTRTIVIYWAFLVLVGFICIWQKTRYGEDDLNNEYPDMSKIMCLPGTNASMMLSPNGTFHRRAIDSTFIQDNGCTDPCNLIDIPSIFRNRNELTLLKHSQELLWNYTIPGPKFQMQEKIMSIANVNFSINYWSLPFIVLQGFITALFGRRDPREIRDLIYITLFMEHPISHKRSVMRIQEGFIRAFAGLNYLIACAVVIFCAPFFILSVVSQEFQLWNNQPDSEKPYQVGQWSAWVYTALVVLAALIARHHDRLIGFIADGCRGCGRGLRNCLSHRNQHQEHEPEHGMAEVKEKTKASLEADSKSDGRRTSVEEMPSNRSSPVQENSHEQGKQKANTNTLSTIQAAYKSGCHPLNQTGTGPIDEMRNFYRWCRNPQEVSRMVIRHPIRVRDTKFIEAPPAVVDASKDDPRAQDQRNSFFRGASIEHHRGAV